MPEALAGPAVLAGEALFWLPQQRNSASTARKLLRDYLGVHGDGERLVAVGELVSSELVANAVEHARMPGRLIAVGLTLTNGRLRMEVHDPSEEPPILRPLAGVDEGSGRGLWLVATLSITWGHRRRPQGIGKIVWALCGPEDGD